MSTSQRPLPDVAPEIARARVIVAHLGERARLHVAIHGGRSVESTMALLRSMDSRWERAPARSIPASFCSLMTAKGMSPAEVQDFLYRDCGLKGLSGVSNDMRELQNSSDPQRCLCRRLFRLQGLLCRRECWQGPCQGLDGFALHRRYRRKFRRHP